jgi:hypothetical protein
MDVVHKQLSLVHKEISSPILFTKYYSDDPVKGNGFGGGCTMYGRDEKLMQNSCSKPNGKDSWDKKGIDGETMKNCE